MSRGLDLLNFGGTSLPTLRAGPGLTGLPTMEAPMSDTLKERGQALEDMFFAEHDRKLIAALKERAAKKEAAEAIGHQTGIDDGEVLSAVAELGVTEESLAAFSMMPLLYVAWGDNVMDEAEKVAILTEALASGIHRDSAAYHLLELWLTREPHPELIATWQSFHTALAAQLSESKRQAIKDDLIARAQRVARASGGFLGFGSVSAAEQAVLEKLEALLG